MARYNSPKKRLSASLRRVLVIAGIGVGIVLAAYVGFSNFKPLSATDVSFDIPDATHASATIEVSRNSAERVQCDLRALNESYAVVGYTSVVLEPRQPAEPTVDRVSVEMRTENLATTAGVDECYEVPATLEDNS